MLQLRVERLRRGWSQTRLGGLAGGISQADISAIECGRRVPGAGWRRRLARAFRMPEATLFSEARTTKRDEVAGR